MSEGTRGASASPRPRADLLRQFETELCRYVSPREATAGVHGLFRYPGKYLPQVAHALVRELVPSGGVVLDPFAGSGTTLVEASSLGRSSVGLDLSPLATLLSRVKTTPMDPLEIDREVARCVARARDFGRRGVGRLPEFRNRDYWFPRSSLTPLVALRESIRRVEDPELERLLTVVFLSIVKDASNASSYQHKLTRSREPDPVTGAAVYTLFLRRASRAAVRYSHASRDAPVSVLRGDCRRLPFPGRAFDAVVTHPPYSISFDFVRCFKIYLWWLDLGERTVELDRRLIGNQRRGAGVLPEVGLPEVDARIRRIHERSARDGLAVAHFYRDMDVALSEWKRVLRPGGRVGLYMGDSRAQHVSIEAPATLIALAKRRGFELVLRMPRRVPEQVASTLRQIHVEEVIVLQSP